jgi:hypothetical protein
MTKVRTLFQPQSSIVVAVIRLSFGMGATGPFYPFFDYNLGEQNRCLEDALVMFRYYGRPDKSMQATQTSTMGLALTLGWEVVGQGELVSFPDQTNWLCYRY